jgi:hypothetical protein
MLQNPVHPTPACAGDFLLPEKPEIGDFISAPRSCSATLISRLDIDLQRSLANAAAGNNTNHLRSL